MRQGRGAKIRNAAEFSMSFFRPSLLFILLALLIGGGVWAVRTYNRFIRLRNQLREGWSGIEVQLKRRHDLVPALVECVRGFRDHERELLETVTRERGEASAATDAASASGPEQALGRDLGRLIAVAETYPELRSSEHFLRLMKDLVEIEEHLQYARRYYNGTARDWNNLVESLPSNFIAAMGGFRETTFFEVAEATERLPPGIARQLRGED
jgi:LemA protein